MKLKNRKLLEQRSRGGTLFACLGARLHQATVLLGVLMVLSWSAGASAQMRTEDDLDGDGLIEILDADDLIQIRNHPDGSALHFGGAGCPAGGCNGFILDADIDLSGIAWEATPTFGDASTMTPTVFDGAGHTIRNLVSDSAFASNGGLFYVVTNAVLRDVSIEDAWLGEGQEDGVLAGALVDSTVSRCRASGSINAGMTQHIHGGLVGACSSSDIDESYAQVDITGGNNLGGLVGEAVNGCAISRSFATGRIEAADWRPGIGGLVGSMMDSSISHSFATGNALYGGGRGALVGTVLTGTSQIDHSFATGRVLGTSPKAGGLIGTVDYGAGLTLDEVYWATDLTGKSVGIDLNLGSVGGTPPGGFTLAELQCPQQAGDPGCGGLYAGWQTQNSMGQDLWSFGTAGELPGLNIQGQVFRDADGDSTLDADDDFPSNYAGDSDADGDGMPDRLKEGCDLDCGIAWGLAPDQFVSNPAASVDLDLDGEPDEWNASCDTACQNASGLVLDEHLFDADNDGIADDIDDDDNGDDVVDTDRQSNGLIDIENATELYAMDYDRDGSSQMFYDTPAGQGDTAGCPVVLFDGVLTRRCDGYELLNDIQFSAGEIWLALGYDQDDPYGAFRANFEGNGHTISTLVIYDTDQQQGLFGFIRDASISNLHLHVSLDAPGGQVGALAGRTARVNISNVYATGTVTTTSDNAGGLVGTLYASTMTNSFADVDVTAGGFNCTTECTAGGLVATLRSSTITASFAAGRVEGAGVSVGGLVGDIDDASTVSASYSIGEVVPATGGGLVGVASSSVIASYWATDSSGQSNSAGGAVGFLDAELRCPTGASDSGCTGMTMYTDWDTHLDEAGIQLWDFGESSELPGLCLSGQLYRPDTVGTPTDCMCAEESEQLVSNQGFESGTSGWNGSYGTSISSSTAQQYSGARSLRVGNRNIDSWQGAEYNLLGQASVGDTLQASMWVRIGGDPSEPVILTLRSTCGGNTDYQRIASVTANDQGWVNLSGSVVVPSCSFTELVMYAEGPQPGVVLYVDDASIESVTQQCGEEELDASVVIVHDWGSGYCAELVLTNTNSMPTTSWEATFNTNGTVITGYWNLQIAGTTGTVTATPDADWTYVLAPGATSHSLGFCANRPPGSSAGPSDAEATGTF